MFNPFTQFALIILVVLGVSILMRILKQPLIIGYILSGILVGPYFFNLIQDGALIQVFSEMGIAFLLFIVGLHLSPKVIKEVGKVSLVTGIGQIIFTVSLAYLFGVLMGFSPLISIYIAVAITFSSTIVVMKLLSDKDDLDKLYGKVSMGLALVQNFIAIVILIVVGSLASASDGFLLDSALKGLVILVLLSGFSYFLLPKVGYFFAKSSEFLFLFAIAWGFGISLLFIYSGFSIEIGALIAGIMFSLSPYSYEVSSKLKPLRDFFIISFFIILGGQMVFGNFSEILTPVLVFSALILIGNPLSVMIFMGILGYSKKTGFMSGLTVAQISEFSLILIALGVRTGALGPEILSFVTLIALITIAGSTYFIIYSDFLFEKFSRFLGIFERKKIKEKEILKKNYDYILFGYNRIGFSIVKSFSRMKKNFLVVDYNPRVVAELKKEGIDAIYGDVDDSEFLEDLSVYKCSLIVSTIPEIETNNLILDVLKRNKANTITLLTARQIGDALELYRAGASYVILPHFLGGEYTSDLIENAKEDKGFYLNKKRKELKNLKERIKKGHEHPRIEKEGV